MSVTNKSLAQLPLELKLKVVSQLECYDVIQLLEALPELKRSTILITDHILPPLFFRNVDGVERKYVKSSYVRGRVLPYFDRNQHKHPIQLVEFRFLPKNSSTSTSGEGDADIPDWASPRFDSNCFLFIRLKSQKSQLNDVVAVERLLDSTPCHWHTGSQTYFSKGTGMKPSFESLAISGDSELTANKGLVLRSPEKLLDFSMVNTLRLETSRPFVEMEFPNLLQLCVVFSLEYDQYGAMVRNEISHIKAPLLQYFVIHYDPLIPTIEELCIGGRRHTERREDLSTRKRSQCTFELADVTAMHGNRCYIPSSEKNIIETKFTDVDLGFIENFGVVRLIGLPSFVLNKCDLSGVIVLRIQLSDTARPDDKTTTIQILKTLRSGTIAAVSLHYQMDRLHQVFAARRLSYLKHHGSLQL